MEFVQKPDASVVVQGEFSLKSLSHFIKCTPLCSHLEMYLGNERNWGNYLSKETHIGNFDCIDYTNTQAAQHVLAQIGK
jgi:hypothetical protein